MLSDEFLFAKLKIPKGYQETLLTIRKNLLNSNYHNLTSNYSKKKQSLKLFDFPNIISKARITSEDFLTNQTVLYSQGLYYGDAAKDAPPNVQPLLYYYAENSLFAFFIYSLNEYIPQHSNSHGLYIKKWDQDIGKTQVEIRTNGFFSRIIDCYTLCRATTHFAALQVSSKNNSFKKTQSKFSILNKPILTLSDLILLREKLGEQQDGSLYDIIDFVLLFIASSFARYRPYLWIELMQGKKNTYFAWYEHIFDRFNLMKFRLMRSLIDISKNQNIQACTLHQIDLVARQQMY